MSKKRAKKQKAKNVKLSHEAFVQQTLIEFVDKYQVPQEVAEAISNLLVLSFKAGYEKAKEELGADTIQAKLRSYLMDNHEHHSETGSAPYRTLCEDGDEPYVNSLKLEEFINNNFK